MDNPHCQSERQKAGAVWRLEHVAEGMPHQRTLPHKVALEHLVNGSIEQALYVLRSVIET